MKSGPLHSSAPRMLTVVSRKSVAIPISEIVTGDRLEIFPEVQSEGYFNIKFRGRDLYLTAGRYVGQIPVNPRITIEVLPKLPVSNIARVVEIAEQRIETIDRFHRLYLRSAERNDGILEFLARNLLTALEVIETYGLARSYILCEENSSHPKGRIHFRQTALLNMSRGVRHKIYSSRYEHTIDIPHNRLLKYALWFVAQRLSRAPRRDRVLLHDINRMLSLFDGVAFDGSPKLVNAVGSDLFLKRVLSHRRYYERALKIALTILSGRGVALVGHGNEIELSSYILDFEKLFESYVRHVLKRNLAEEVPSIRVRDGNGDAKKGLFDGRKDPSANPDIVIDSSGSIKLIADVKYKEKIDRADINQAITYGCSYRVQNLLLIYQSASGEASGVQTVGTIGRFDLYKYAFDLSNVSLENEEKALTQTILQLCGYAHA